MDEPLEELIALEEMNVSHEALIREYREMLLTWGVNLDSTRPGLSEEDRVSMFESEIELLMPAAKKLILAATLERTPTENRLQLLADFRRTAISRLMSTGYWRGPWIRLIDHEFPGEDPAIEDLMGDLQNQEEVSEEVHWRMDEIREDILARLAAYEYPVALGDFSLVVEISVLAFPKRYLSGVSHLPIGTLLERIQHSASAPDHPAWQEIVQEYLGSSA